MRTITSLIVGLFVVLAMAIPAEAQNSWDAECNSLDAQARQAPRHLQRQMYEMARQCWSARYDQYNRQRAFEKDRMRGFDPYYSQQSYAYGGGGMYNPAQNFGGRGYYDPAYMMYLQDFLRIPGVLGSCKVENSSTEPGKHVAVDCHWLTRAALDDRGSPTKEFQDHLQAYPMGTYALGTQHAEKGRMEFRAYDPTHKPFNQNHKTCLPIEVRVSTVAASEENKGPVVERGASSPSSDQYQTPKPVAGPAASSGGGEFSLSNSSPFRGEVYYNDKYLGRLNPGASMKVDYPEGEGRYTAHLLVPNEEGGISSLPAKIVPGNNGFTFADPTSAGR